jgi:hypothetical protein
MSAKAGLGSRSLSAGSSDSGFRYTAHGPKSRIALLPRRFPAVPDALQQPTLALGLVLGRVAGVDLAGLTIHDLVRPVCLSNAVGQRLSFPFGKLAWVTARGPLTDVLGP